MSYLRYLIIIVITFALWVGINTYLFNPKQIEVEAENNFFEDPQSVINFSKAIQYPTISYQNKDQWDSLPFIEFKNFLDKTYPLISSRMDLVKINKYSYIYHWKSNSNKKPIILLAHQDVVPIEEVNKSKWEVEPFSGEIKDGYIWGRGAVDDKVNLIAMMEAMERLFVQGNVPNRDIYFAFGHDEEIGGVNGAMYIAKWFEDNEITPDLILDEGSYVTEEKLKSVVAYPVALIGVAEKGYMSVDLEVEMKGGHSSMPEKETSIDVLLKALTKIKENSPFSRKITEPVKLFMENIGAFSPWYKKMIFANFPIFNSLIIKGLEEKKETDALLHTTIVPTIINAGIKENIIPSKAVATLNLRLLQGDDIEGSIVKINETIDDDRVKVILKGGILSEPSKITSHYSKAYKKIDTLIKKIFKNTVTTPFLLSGATDSRHYNKLSDNIIKFSPMIDPIGFHGINERISIGGFQKAIQFYTLLLSKY